MTEDEAKTKWCPFARYKSHNGEGINRWVDDGDFQLSPEPAKCIASACAAWRSIDALHAFDSETGEDLGVRPAIRAPTQEFRLVPAGGFCGLAGKP